MLNMVLIPESGNSKTGSMIVTYTERVSCPTRCPFKGNGCYGESIRTATQWKRASDNGDKRAVSTPKALEKSLASAVALQAVSKGVVMFRHNIAGDICTPGTNDIDQDTLDALIKANSKAKQIAKLLEVEFYGYTYTHADTNDTDNVSKIKNTEDFIINVSCETISEVVQARSEGLNTVLTSATIIEDIEALKTCGINAVQCPNQTRGVHCDKCKLCARNRKTVVLFEVHGNGKKKAGKVIQIKRA